MRPAIGLSSNQWSQGRGPEGAGEAAWRPALSRSGRCLAARWTHQAADPGAGARGRFRLDGADASRCAVGGTRFLRNISAALRAADTTARPRAQGGIAQAYARRAGRRRLLDHLDVAARPSAGAPAANAVRAAHGAFEKGARSPQWRFPADGGARVGTPATRHGVGCGVRH